MGLKVESNYLMQGISSRAPAQIIMHRLGGFD